MKDLSAKWNTSIDQISKEDWESVGNYDLIPFFQWNWLYDLEKSGSIIPSKGWQPLYLSIWRKTSLIGIAPLFLKNHSFGEFIFDHLFVELANKIGKKYYPKLVGMSPVSPVEGYRFLIRENENAIELTDFMIKEIDKFSIKNKIFSCSFLYVDKAWQLKAECTKCQVWINQKSHWHANEMVNFSDYLAKFNSNQRRNIKREREYIKKSNIDISILHGDQINTKDMKIMHYFYEKHCARWGIWGSKYLSESFFAKLASIEHKEKVILFKANKDNFKEPIAMSLCITNGKQLWGRYWGSKEEINNLHFELCYYSPINWALNNGISSFDPGAGGSHKRRRGFLAEPSTSLFRWYDPTMNALMKTWLPQSNQFVMEEIEASNSELPFKDEISKILH